MNRRAFLAGIPALAILPTVGTERPKMGPLNPHQWTFHKNRTGERLHVWCDGENITVREPGCVFYADDIAGEVKYFKRNASGGKYLDGNRKLATVTLRGHVQFIPGPPFTW